MFCANCGNKLENDARFCDSCGAKVGNVENTSADPAVAGQAVAAAVKPAMTAQKRNRIIGISVIGAAALIVIVVALIIILSIGGNSPEDVALDFVDAMFDYDVEEVLDLMPEDLINNYLKSEGMTKDALIYELQSELTSEMMSEFGGILDVKCTVGGVVYMDRYSIEEINEDLYYDFFAAPNCVTEACEVEVLMSVSIFGMNETTSMYVEVLCIDGDWYLSPYAID